MTAEAERFTFGESPKDEGLPIQMWLVTGRIRGETPGAGLWIEVESKASVPVSAPSEADFKPGDGAILFRWAAISGAVVFDEKHELREFGFRQRQ